MSGVPKFTALCIKADSEGCSYFIDYRFRRSSLVRRRTATVSNPSQGAPPMSVDHRGEHLTLEPTQR
jgi:hypothetical protein